MALHPVNLDLRTALAGPTACPGCGEDLTAVGDRDGVVFHCTSCPACWRVELGRLTRVDPSTLVECRAIQDAASGDVGAAGT